MRLTHIKLAGFKSFVDPTAIPVAYDLVGIVGPNGCGKSNVIDAVRWVLGESKASALRGDSMQDVIFAGSTNRKAVGRASVEIVFDNHSGKIAGQWSSYGEIAIKRVLQRDGGSSYYINNLQVRRRDIADLFHGTGAGSRGYAIIEQGMISQIIEAKPQEMRNFLEEAAGISQYRERRQETSARLAETRKNLIRLQDIHQELNVQLRHLETQAMAAQQYQSLQEKLHTAQVVLWHQRKTEAMLQYDQIKLQLAELEASLHAMTTAQRDAEQEFEEIRAGEYLANEHLLQVQGRLYGADAEIERLEQQINRIGTTKERLIQQTQSIGDQLQKNDQMKAVNAKQLSHWQQEKIAAEQHHRQYSLEHETQNRQFPVLEADYQRYQDELSQCRHGLLMAEQNNQLENNHVSHADKNIRQLEARQQRLSQEQSELVFVDSAKLTELQQETDRIDAALSCENQKQQTLEQQLSDMTALKQQIEQDIQESKHRLTKLIARQAALRSLQQKLDNNQQLTTWLNERNWSALPRLWQGIQIAAQWETALEAILRERLNGLQCVRIDAVLDSLQDIPAGKWVVFDGNSQAQTMSHRQLALSSSGGGRLLDFLVFRQPEAQCALEDWLCHVYVAKNIQEALAKRTELQTGETIVTPEGHIVTRHSCAFYAPDSNLHGVLSRQQELASLQGEIDQIEAIVAEKQSKLTQAESDYDRLNADVKNVRMQRNQLQQRLHQLQLESLKLTQGNERSTYRNRQIATELDEIQHALNNELTLRQAAINNLTDNRQQIEALRQTVEQVQLSWKAANESLAKHRQIIQQFAQKIQETVFYLKTCDSKINEIQLIIQHADENAQRLAAERADLLKEIDSCDDASSKSSLEIAQTHRAEIKTAMEQVRLEMADTAHRLREIEIVRLESEQKSHALREAVVQARLKEQASLLNIEQLSEMIDAANADTASITLLAGKKSMAALQSEIQRFTKEIAALGAVNLASIDELESTRKRESDLLVQMNDLNDAVAILESAIRQIDRETQMRLQETFTQVNVHLDEIFPIIFAGGQAKLVCSNENDIEDGFVLMAQPPGKKNSSIHLLSGGEKALTALALVFSLFKLNPAPFCLLDEVDAPLDDTNTERFCELVKEMAKQTQFLFISHNKITMEMAHRLIGVTMQERGVSRIVAVDLADAVKLGMRDTRAINE